MKKELSELFRSKFFCLVLGFFTGIVLWKFIPLSGEISLLGVSIAVAVFLYSLRFRFTAFLFVAIFCLGLFGGLFRFYFYEANLPHGVLNNFVGKKVTVEGLVSSEVDNRENGTNFRLRVLKIEDEIVSASNLHVLVRADLYESKIIGDKVRVSGELISPENFETETGRIFDYISYLEKDKVFYILQKTEVEFVSPSKDFRRFIFSTKKMFIGGIKKALPEPTSSLAGGILLGTKSSLGTFWEEAFRRAGIIHIVVLSGFNITVVAEFFIAILFFISPLARLIVASLGIGIFSVMVGASAPVLRASIMAFIAILGRATHRRYNVSRALLFSAMIMVAFVPPLLISDLFFQLSFLATVGVVYGAPIFERFLYFLPKFFGLRNVIATTLAAQTAVLPLLLYSIGELSLVSPFANMLVLPIVPIAMLLSFIAGLAGIFAQTAGLFFGFPAYLSLSYILFVSDFLTKPDLATVNLPSFPIATVFVAYIFLGYFFFRFIRD